MVPSISDRDQAITPTTKRPDQEIPEQTSRQQDLYTSESSLNAIAAISDSPSQYTSFSSSDNEEAVHSSDPDLDPEVNEDAASEVIGVSISRAQSRMKARATPAEEKNRVLEQQGNYFVPIPDATRENGLFVSDLTEEPEPVKDSPPRFPQRLPQRFPQRFPNIEIAKNRRPRDDAAASHPPAQTVEPDPRAGPHGDDTAVVSKDSAGAQRSSFTRSLLKNSLPLRPRSWSNELKKILPDLGSLAKRPSLSFRSGITQHNRGRSQTAEGSPYKQTARVPQRTTSLVSRHPQSPRTSDLEHDDEDGDDARSISELKPLEGSSAVKHSYSRRPSTTGPRRPPSLRRSSSDQSLYLRASSTASSLEQRPRYENVHSQVNSRFKAIKDSLQDSSSRLLSMPTLNLHDIRNDWTSKPFFIDRGSSVGASSAAKDRALNGTHTHTEPPSPPPPPKNHPQSTHPVLEEAMRELTGDVVILGGYRGSILRSAKPPHQQLWAPMKVGLNLRKVDLEVGLTREDEENMEEKIIPSGVLSHVGPVDVCRRLIKRLQKCDNAIRGDLRVWNYGYDWRLSPDLLSQRLIGFLENLPSNQSNNTRRGAYVIAHSLGGLITRHAVNQRPDLFAGVVYAGVPQHCVNILGPLRNGDDVLLSSRVLTAQVNFTFRTSYALLPEDGHCFINKHTKEEYPVDFFDARNWDEYRLSPCIRFSLGGREDHASSSDAQYDSTTDEESYPGKTPPTPQHSSTAPLPEAAVANASEKLHRVPSAADGIVGPVPHPRGSSGTSKASTTITIPRAAAVEYLERTLAEVKHWKSGLEFNPEHQQQNKYPPAAVLFGKSVPTVYGARVTSREAIKHQDAYDDLAFAAGDGVCLASAAMLPPGYRIIKDGLVKSDRGHVGLLGDLEGVGQCLRAIVWGEEGRRWHGSL
ncbi:hypothetical protein N7468_002270 [Penicillium chermesinum]|uniref:Uncharacterized protein n=1 Tax=Penicillium chermesinum TaxID=63820 RepID=A0A9W9PL39_9EURO|nr:uncharacterized protein N7468_002270 [Penicillium chermesinum]KAJ5247287.1 hypothetical protein N7468_002270 [Penicillium chermesinum]